MGMETLNLMALCTLYMPSKVWTLLMWVARLHIVLLSMEFIGEKAGEDEVSEVARPEVDATGGSRWEGLMGGSCALLKLGMFRGMLPLRVPCIFPRVPARCWSSALVSLNFWSSPCRQERMWSNVGPDFCPGSLNPWPIPPIPPKPWDCAGPVLGCCPRCKWEVHSIGTRPRWDTYALCGSRNVRQGHIKAIGRQMWMQCVMELVWLLMGLCWPWRRRRRGHNGVLAYRIVACVEKGRFEVVGVDHWCAALWDYSFPWLQVNTTSWTCSSRWKRIQWCTLYW